MGKAPKELDRTILNKMQGILKTLDGRYTINNGPSYASMVNYSTLYDEPVHRWFRYREGYSTNLIKTLLRDVTPGSLVVDPFCGSGTTPFVAKNSGFRSIGIDVNPLSVFVTKVKTRNYSLDQLQNFETVCRQLAELQVTNPAAPRPSLQIIEKVFHQDVLHALLVLKHYIDNNLGRLERDFFFLAWLSILEKVSNVYREGNGIKYRNRKRTPNGYINIPINLWQETAFPEDKFAYVVGVFLDQAQLMINDIRNTPQGGLEPEIFCGDALGLSDFVENNSTSLVAFSPPYVNNFNYFKAYKVELWMGGFTSTYTDFQEISRLSLRSHVETQLVRDTDSHNWYPEELDSLIELIDMDTLWTPRIIKAIRGYFYDMHKVLTNVYEALEAGGKCAIVVGNSAYGSILIPTDTLLAETASNEGFIVEKLQIARHLTTSSQQKQALETSRQFLRESIIFLQKPRSGSDHPARTNGQIKYRFVAELPRFPSQSHSIVYVIKNKGLTDITHIFHKYPGKFIPHIPRWAIEKYVSTPDSCVVLDPFCGSGTTLVEASLAGHRAYGVDIDPLARLITKVKTTPIPEDVMRDATQNVITEVQTRTTSNFRPSIDTIEHWFTPDGSNDLGIIRESIERWRGTNQDVYDFLVIAFSSIIRRVSKADNQSLKTYVSGTHKKTPASAKSLFINTLNDYAVRIQQYQNLRPANGYAKVLDDFRDSRSFAGEWVQQGLPRIDLAITSPPYIKTVDYIYNQMAEYFWIGDLFNLENQSKQNAAKKLYIGTEKISSDTYKQVPSLDHPRLDAYLEQIKADDIKHGYIFYKYFYDLRLHFEEMHKVLSDQGVYVMVVGNSSISNIHIPTNELLAIVASTAGFGLQSQFCYEIRNRYMRFPRQGRGGQVDLDWIMTFTKR